MNVYVLLDEAESFGDYFEVFVAAFATLEDAMASVQVSGFPEHIVYPQRKHPMGWRETDEGGEWLYCRLDTKTVGWDAEQQFIREVEVKS